MIARIDVKRKEDDSVECLSSQVYPVEEVNLHNYDDPETCFCSPEIFLYADESGQAWDLSLVIHHYIQ